MISAENLSMTQSRTPRGVPAGGEFAANEHAEAVPLANDDGFDSRGAKFVSKDEVKVGDIVWDGSSGFVVSDVESGVVSQMESWSRGREARSSVVYRSAQGDFWHTSPHQDRVVVLRDEDALEQHREDADEEYDDED